VSGVNREKPVLPELLFYRTLVIDKIRCPAALSLRLLHCFPRFLKISSSFSVCRGGGVRAGGRVGTSRYTSVLLLTGGRQVPQLSTGLTSYSTLYVFFFTNCHLSFPPSSIYPRLGGKISMIRILLLRVGFPANLRRRLCRTRRRDV